MFRKTRTPCLSGEYRYDSLPRSVVDVSIFVGASRSVPETEARERQAVHEQVRPEVRGLALPRQRDREAALEVLRPLAVALVRLQHDVRPRREGRSGDGALPDHVHRHGDAEPAREAVRVHRAREVVAHVVLPAAARLLERVEVAVHVADVQVCLGEVGHLDLNARPLCEADVLAHVREPEVVHPDLAGHIGPHRVRRSRSARRGSVAHARERRPAHAPERLALQADRVALDLRDVERLVRRELEIGERRERHREADWAAPARCSHPGLTSKLYS